MLIIAAKFPIYNKVVDRLVEKSVIFYSQSDHPGFLIQIL